MVKYNLKKLLPQSEFINRCIQKYGYKYNYDLIIYLGMYIPINIGCPLHGEFQVIARNFLNGTECQKCKNSINKSKFNKNEIFIKKANLIHNNKYNYSLIDYQGYKNKLEIICNTHGKFIQSAGSHLSGSGCPECAKIDRSIAFNKTNYHGFRKSQWVKNCNNESYLYIIKCFNKDEEFLKIGITKHFKLNNRYSKKSLPYNYEIVEIIKNIDPNITWNLEKEILKNFSSNKYLPNIDFRGKYECLNISCINDIKNYICHIV